MEYAVLVSYEQIRSYILSLSGNTKSITFIADRFVERQTLSPVFKHARTLRAETHLGPDGTRLQQNAQARL